jgi:hypothetical protein
MLLAWLRDEFDFISATSASSPAHLAGVAMK